MSTIRAIDYIVGENLVLLTSLEMNTWELILALGSRAGARILILVPSPDRNFREIMPEIIRRFRLDGNRTGFLFFDDTLTINAKAAWPLRDRKIADLADMIIPVSIRPGGNVAFLVEQNREKVIDAYTTKYQSRLRPRPRYDKSRLIGHQPEGDILVHFTRTTASPWPDETDYDFYLALAASTTEYCRSALNNLLHIVKSTTIFASAKNIRGGHRVVGFTTLSNANFQQLFRYRRRLVNPYFEPYGLGISADTAAKIGVRPVRYGSPEIYENLPEMDKPFFQNVGQGERWRPEQEWRYSGDFHFADIPEDDLYLFVAYHHECESMQANTGIRVRPLLI